MKKEMRFEPKRDFILFPYFFRQKRGAQLVVLEGKRREVWENTWSESCLDLHLMSSGAARAMVHAWLLNIRSIVYEGHELPKLLRYYYYYYPCCYLCQEIDQIFVAFHCITVSPVFV